MAFNFPSPANVGDIYSSGGTTFQFDGVAWNYVNTTAVLAYNQANAAYTRANSAAQITFGTVIANGSSIVAASNNDTLTIIANANVSIVGNTSTKNITFDITDTGVIGATYGNSTIVPVFTVDTKGRLTSVTNTTINVFAFGVVVANGTNLVAGKSNDILTIRTTGNVAIAADAAGDNMTFDLTTTGVTAATYGSATIVPVLTVDARGRLTTVTNTSINVFAFGIVAANGTSLLADTSNDTLTIRTTGNVSITADAAGDNMTFDLTTTGVTAATYGSATIVPVLTVDARGRLTTVTNTTIDLSSTVLKTGNTMTGNLVMSGANITFLNVTNSGIYWTGTGSSFIYSPAANTLVMGTAFGEDVRIDASGNVGIATSPVAKLDVSGSFSVAKANVLNQTLTYGANAFTNWDASLGQIATVTLTGTSSTLNTATNLRVGTYILHVIQDATGGRLLTFGSGYKFTGAFAPVLTTSASARDVFSFVSDGTNLYGAMIPDVR